MQIDWLRLLCRSRSRQNRLVVADRGRQEELFGRLKAPVRRLGAPYSPVPFSKPLEDAFLVQPDDVVKAVQSVMN